MSRFVFLTALVFSILQIAVAPAHAGKFYFGGDEKLHVIAPTGLMHEGKVVSICYKAYIYFFVAGVYTTDELVLCEGGTSTRYSPMPTGEKLLQLQNAGLLPTPLPSYTRHPLDYVFGYSLWILLGLMVPFGYASQLRTKANAKKNADLFKLMALRIMARTASSSLYGPERGYSAAYGIFQQLFKEPMHQSDFAAEMKWAYEQPAAYEGFIKTISKRFDKNAKAVLLRAAAYVALADGNMDQGEEQAIAHLASCLGMRPKEVNGFLVGLRQQQSAPAQPQTGQAIRQGQAPTLQI